jgi:hypothetical protein
MAGSVNNKLPFTSMSCHPHIHAGESITDLPFHAEVYGSGFSVHTPSWSYLHTTAVTVTVTRYPNNPNIPITPQPLKRSLNPGYNALI